MLELLKIDPVEGVDVEQLNVAFSRLQQRINASSGFTKPTTNYIEIDDSCNATVKNTIDINFKRCWDYINDNS